MTATYKVKGELRVEDDRVYFMSSDGTVSVVIDGIAAKVMIWEDYQIKESSVRYFELGEWTKNVMRLILKATPF